MDKEALYWFFSANAQVFGAVIGILGVFTVFAMQQIHQLIQTLREDLNRVMSRLVHQNYSVYSFRVQMEKAHDELQHQYQSNLNGGGRIDPVIIEGQNVTASIESLITFRKSTIKDFIHLLIVLFAVLISSILLLPISWVYELYPRVTLGWFWFVLIGSVTSLVGTGFFVTRVLGYERHDQRDSVKIRK